MGWPISERGRDMEESKAQMDAKDRVNLWTLEQAKKRSEERLAKKSQEE
jgi:hypothetical protein